MLTNHSGAVGAGPADPNTAFFEALRAPGPPAERGENRNLYDGVLGSWDATVVDHLPDGTDRRQSAEMHFVRVLEGRAIQDLWIAPARTERTAAVAGGNRYGTTLRAYDPKIDAWRITWINPVTGVENRLVGRHAGNRIVQTGSDAGGRLVRWVFDEVHADSFHWRGERSEDGGRTWACDTEFTARRRSAPAVAPSTRRADWEWSDRPGLESLVLETASTGAVAKGSSLVVLDGVPLKTRYRIEHDAAWRPREALIEEGSGGASRRLRIHRRQDGRWEVDGALREDLDGCEDVDLMITPYTNTPPLAARPLAPGESRSLKVAWVRFPDLEIRAIRQEYTRLEDAGPGQARYRYRNLDSGFTGELTVDNGGLVVDYGPWRRR